MESQHTSIGAGSIAGLHEKEAVAAGKRGQAVTLSGVLLNAFFIIYTVLCLIPIVLVLMISFTDESVISIHGYKLIPEKFSTYAYEFVLADWQSILNAYTITIVVTVAGTVLGVLITSMYAYVISRKDFRYRNTFSFIVFFTMLFSGGLVPWYIMWTKMMHLGDTVWILFIPGCLNAFYVMVMKSFFANNIPDSIIESAKIDGAGEFRTYFKIVTPLAVPGLATIGLFLALGYWNDWYTPLVFINKRNLVPIQYFLYEVQSRINFLNSVMNMGKYKDALSLNTPDETARMALAVVGIGPIVLAYPFFQRFFISGLTIGAVKG